MAIDLPTIRQRVQVDDGELGEASGRFGRFGAAFGKAAKVVGAAGIAVGAAMVGAAFKTAAAGDEIAKTAPKLGISTDALQEMHYWADRNGLSHSAMERAVGRLNQRIGRAITGNEKYAKAFADLGVEIEDTNGKARATEDVMADTIAALSGIEDPALRSAAASEIFGTKMARDLMPALQDGALSLEEAAEMAHELGLVMDGETLQAAERFQDAWADVRESLTGMMRRGATPVMMFLADRLFPFLRDTAVPVLRELSRMVGEVLRDAWARLEPVIASVQSFLEPIIDRALHLWAVFSEGTDVVDKFAGLIDSVFGANTSGRILEWVGLVRDNLEGYRDTVLAVFEHVREAVGPLLEAFGRIAAVAQDVVARVVGAFGDGEAGTRSAFDSIRSFTADVWPRIAEIVKGAVDLIVAVVETAAAIIEWVWDTFGDTIVRLVSDAWGAVQRIIGGALDVVLGIFDLFVGILTGDWQRAWDGLRSILSGAWSIIRGLVDAAVAAVRAIITGGLALISAAWSAAWNGAVALLAAAWDRARTAVASGINGVLSFVQGMPGRISSALRALPRILFDLGRDMIQGLLDGIRALAGRIAGAITEPIKGAVDKAKSFLRIGSPSKLLRGIGEDTGEGFALGVEDKQRRAAEAARKLAAAAARRIDGDGQVAAAVTPGPAAAPRQVEHSRTYNLTATGSPVTIDEDELLRMMRRLELVHAAQIGAG